MKYLLGFLQIMKKIRVTGCTNCLYCGFIHNLFTRSNTLTKNHLFSPVSTLLRKFEEVDKLSIATYDFERKRYFYLRKITGNRWHYNIYVL